MSSSQISFWSTKWALDIATKLVKADVRVHNLDAIQGDMAIIYAVNHFTRLETLLLPYVLHKYTGKEVWSLASSELFRGRIGAYLRSMGTVSTKDPDRDKSIVRSLLTGDHPWIIFPEGAMIKDKKVIDHRREFSVYSEGSRRPPHKGAAMLALRAEFFRQKLHCLAESPNQDSLAAVKERFNLSDLSDALGKRTMIVPVNVTYFPIRAGDNLFLRFARGVAKELSPRALEELSVEGTLLSEDTHIDITLGEPIDVRSYLDRPEYAAIMACGENDVRYLEEDPKSVFSEAARDIVRRYMRDIYVNATINCDHIFATLVRYQTTKTFTERAYRNRVFLAVQRLLEMDRYRVHPELRKTYQDILYEEPSPRFQDFMSLCISEGIIRKEGNLYHKNFNAKQGVADFHAVRQKELTYVIANEIEPLQDVVELVKDVARTPGRRLSKVIRTHFVDEDRRLYAEDYAAFAEPEFSKDPEVGQPFLLAPRLRTRGGVVLIHGYLAAPLEVRSLATYLYRNGYAVYGVRLKGHGTSPADLARTHWEEWYESVNRGYAIIKSLTDNVIVGGFSTGGGLALLAAGRKGPNVRAAFSINAPLHLRNFAARFAPSLATVNTLYTRVRGRKSQWEFVENCPENEHINYTRNPVSGVRELGKAMTVMEAVLPNIAVPTLIVQGSRDPLVNPVSGQLIFDRIGAASKQLAVLERDRHGIINGEGAQDVFEHVHRFLDWAEEKPPELVLQVRPSATDVA